MGGRSLIRRRDMNKRRSLRIKDADRGVSGQEGVEFKGHVQ